MRTSFICSLKIISFVLLILVTYSCTNSPDATADEFCDCLKENQNLSEAEQLNKCRGILSRTIDWKDDENTIKEKFQELDSLLLTNCSIYKELVLDLSSNDGEWIILSEDKDSELSKDQCNEFKKHHNFFYFESNGDTTRLKIMNDLWIDNFNNGKYFSYLKLSWISPCEFQIELVETSEPSRKENFNIGDTFQYRIINMSEDYFIMMVTFEDIKQEFKLYMVK